MAGLAMRRASASVSATTIWRSSPIAVPPGNSGLGTARAGALGERLAVGRDVALGERGRPIGGEMHAALARPGGADLVGGAVPERRMRLLQRPQRHRHVRIGEMRARMVQGVVGQAGADAGERIHEDLARLIVRDLVEVELERRDPAPHADLEPAVAQVIEHADFLDQAQRRIERQEIDQRPQPHARGRARDRAQIDARHRHHVERGGMMLRHVQAIDAGRLGRDRELQPLVELRRERTIAALDMIEESDFHVCLVCPVGQGFGTALGRAPLF